jgi:hypothetical protein
VLTARLARMLTLVRVVIMVEGVPSGAQRL